LKGLPKPQKPLQIKLLGTNSVAHGAPPTSLGPGKSADTPKMAWGPARPTKGTGGWIAGPIAGPHAPHWLGQ